MDEGRSNKAYEKDSTEHIYWKNNKKLSSNSEKIQISNDEKDYDPYENRTTKYPIGTLGTLIHLLKGSLGTGILAMPAAFKNSGYVLGLVATFIIGLICLYSLHILVLANHELSRRKRVPQLTYPEISESAFADGPPICRKLTPIIGHVTKIFLIVVQLGTSCVYVVFIASNVKSIIDVYTPDKNNYIDIRLYMCMILLPLILINWIRNLKYLTPFTTVGNGVTVVSFAVILYYIFRDPISMENRVAVGTIDRFPLFLGTVLFALEAVGMIIPLHNEMKTPKNFGKPIGVLNISMTIIIVLYLGLGFFGYLRYGNDVQGSITLNLAENEILAQSVKGMLAFSMFITHALQSYVAIDTMWNLYVKNWLKPTANFIFWEYVVRTICVLITFICAVAIPNLELFISLVGALCFAVLGLVLPALIQISAWWYQTQGFARLRLIVLNSIVFLVGIIGFIIGSTVSLIEIIQKFSSENNKEN